VAYGIERTGALTTILAVTVNAGFWISIARSRLGPRLGLARRLQRLGFYCLTGFWAVLGLSFGIEGRGGSVANSNGGEAVILTLTIAAAAFLLVDFYREIMKPPQDLPPGWH
jgi:hypothetical protein